MNAAVASSSPVLPGKFPEPLDENDHLVTVRRCSLTRKKLLPEGEPQTLNLKEAVALLAPSKTRLGLANVIRLKTGQYVGVKSGDLSNFVIVNPTNDGDIRWLLKKHPDLASQIRDVYLVESVTIRRNAIDLPSDGEGNGDRT
jgi:hypothetical protein